MENTVTMPLAGTVYRFGRGKSDVLYAVATIQHLAVIPLTFGMPETGLDAYGIHHRLVGDLRVQRIKPCDLQRMRSCRQLKLLSRLMLQVRQPVDSFKQAYGLYADTWSPVAQSLINLALSIVFVVKYGIIGVFLGTLISQFLISMIWRPYYMFTYGFKINHGIYWKGFGFHILYLGITYAIYYFIFGTLDVERNSGLLEVFIELLKSGLIFALIYFLILRIFSKGFKDLIERIMTLIRARF